jgi:hypothetical protein
MGINQKQTQIERKSHFERQLKDRLSSLSEKGMESPRILRDTIVKKLRADIGAINARLKTIASYEEKTKELAKAKAEKAEAPPKDRGVSKEKKAKEAPVEGKAKKNKK